MRGILFHVQRVRAILATFFVMFTMWAPLCAQNKGKPGKFDFYLLDMPWGPDFCSIADVSPQCKPQRGFVVHGLWPQNNDGSYPVFCSNESGPMNPRENLDLTPDPHLLAHEWDKHGTCSAQGPKRYFQMAHEAFASIHVPLALDRIDRETSMSPTQILDLFYTANPQLPKDSLVVSCREEHLTAVEACFTKNLKPMRCLGLHSCTAPLLKIESPPAAQKK